MDIEKILKDNWIVIFGFLILASLALAWAQKWLDIELKYFLILSGILAVLFTVWHKKESKTMSIEEAYRTAVPLLNKFKVGTEQGVKLRWAVRTTDQKRFSSSGKVFDMEFSGSPNKHVVMVDAKTGNVVGVALDIEGREPPFMVPREEVQPVYRMPRVRRKVEEEVQPTK